ncbi:MULTISPECIES: aspartyl-phosphate phosphatase Spo0E family protein [Clostridium]|jgi:hypothetical protein|uniref:Spo0E like sporulation regulatory protein n=3 Tax=Clostridium intestinale TaxID=36845 RepID=U2NML2_9CLOT|nr:MULTISPECIES: aspartyl-phosphate phosphatase Spo0E family protein [Clostridium]ERK30081.1 hypothetical protein CINTURNW_2168 [Clostridium intestinale URNW]QLY81959.1 aspartyl-phosphate phosphatase Spo0E family protein [Clostridium intestinale]WRY53090.1 aspartyl-phosphate phosphatase Spo0E family protein [Clostridium intestinale]SHH50878.1 Spo0E like sporulation regulatory protein [Clostridium intestinale DSM 6191]
MGRILLLIEKKRFELNKAIEIFGINDYRVLIISEELDKLITIEQRMRLWLAYTGFYTKINMVK